MSRRENAYTVRAADEAGRARIVRILRQDYSAVFGRRTPPRDVRQMMEAILDGRVGEPIHTWRRMREIPEAGWPDGDRYDYRVHTTGVDISTSLDTTGPEPLYRAAWTVESSYLYYAQIGGILAAGRLDEIFAIRKKWKEKRHEADQSG